MRWTQAGCTRSFTPGLVCLHPLLFFWAALQSSLWLHIRDHQLEVCAYMIGRMSWCRTGTSFLISFSLTSLAFPFEVMIFFHSQFPPRLPCIQWCCHYHHPLSLRIEQARPSPLMRVRAHIVHSPVDWAYIGFWLYYLFILFILLHIFRA